MTTPLPDRIWTARELRDFARKRIWGDAEDEDYVAPTVRKSDMQRRLEALGAGWMQSR